MVASFRHHHTALRRIVSRLCSFGRHASIRAHATPLTQLTSDAELSALVRRFPTGIDYSFGYGSGVLRQRPPSPHENAAVATPGMIDIILATSDPHAWHKENLRRHAEHYSQAARMGGPRFVTWLQQNVGAKLYFHPFVEMDVSADSDGGRCGGSDSSRSKNGQRKRKMKERTRTSSSRCQIKYGVITTNDLIRDLMHWDHLYAAGRMHKPIVPIGLSPESSVAEGRCGEAADRAGEVDEAQRANLLAAVAAALLMHDAADDRPPISSTNSLSASQLYKTIARISYTGDFRMRTGAEDPNKVDKLVDTPGMGALWDAMYSETLGMLQTMGLLSVVDGSLRSDSGNKSTHQHASGEKHLECNTYDMAARTQLVRHLPLRLRRHSHRFVGTENQSNSARQGSLELRRELAGIVARSARSQSLKGFFTAGVSKSWRYAKAKMSKSKMKG